MEIGTLKFSSKKEAKSYFASYLREHETIEEADIENVKSLISRHPKIGTQIFEPFIDFDKKGRGTRCFWCEFPDGTSDSVSVPTCVDSHYNLNSQLNEITRELVEDEIAKFRGTQTRNGALVCELCGCEGNGKGFHVDHYYPQFVEIRDSFIKEEGLEFEEATIERFKFDEELRRRWRDYHNSKCRLRILCANCNLRRKRSKN